MITIPGIPGVRQEQTILVIMLENLHFATWYSFGSHFSQSLLLVHFGMFLIWQPILKADKELSLGKGFIFIGFTLVLIYWINWVFIAIWLILLIGFVGGRVTTAHHERNIYMLVMIFLIFELLISLVPQMVGFKPNKTILAVFQIGLPVLPLALLIMPITQTKKTNESVDIFLATIFSFMVIVIALGSMELTHHNNVEYTTSLIATLILVGFILMGISWLLSPQIGFSGLLQLWTKSLLNIGTPFEEWLARLSKQKTEQKSARDFLNTAMTELVSLPWVAGARWIEGATHRNYGERSKHEIHLNISDETITLFTHVPTTGVMSLHCNLLVQLIDTFYIAKKQEQELEQKAHLHAIYETGGRVTHDIKNLLQSLKTMTTLLDTTSDDTREKSFYLLKKQLPHVSQRLQLALNKLQAPEQETTHKIPATKWWESLSTRLQELNIGYINNITQDVLVPEELFNSVVENLLENAIHKRQIDTEIIITVSFITNANSIVLRVSDTGHAVARDIEHTILKEHVASDNGHGIGLYQAARQAETFNYGLELEKNCDGNVIFELSSKLAAET